MGFDASVFFQGTGNHYWYPNGQTMNFWGCYSASYLSFMPIDFHGKVWSEDNPDAYFPRPRAYSATGGYLAKVNDHYLQNIRYLRLKNLTVGYTIPVSSRKKPASTRSASTSRARISPTGRRSKRTPNTSTRKPLSTVRAMPSSTAFTIRGPKPSCSASMSLSNSKFRIQ